MSATTRSAQPSVWARRLKEARLAAGLSQRQLGIDAGVDEFVSSARMNRYELGVHRPDYGIAVQLARVLDVPVAYLYCDDDEMAEMLIAFHRVPAKTRRHVLEMLRKAGR